MTARPPDHPTTHPPSVHGLAFVIVMLGCAGNVSAQQDSTAVAGSDLPPVGYGTLRQEDIALRLEIPTLAIRIIPLDERVTRLLAPDSYAALHRLHESKLKEIQEVSSRSGSARPTAFLVTFFGRQDRARFEPEIVTITSQNRFFRPLEILPLTPLWSGRQLNQRETASAVYVFEDGIRLLDPFTISYDRVSNQEWEQRLRTLDRERASALARAAAGRKP